MGDAYENLAVILESCRVKPNVGACDRGGEISDIEATELVSEVADFKSDVERWLQANHPELRPPSSA